MKELVVISGKGGTGKTSVVASFASLAADKVLADCDVDAADLHLVLAPAILSTHEFRSGYQAAINQDSCKACGWCMKRCRFGAVRSTHERGQTIYAIDPVSCEGCGVCVDQCPAGAIDFPESLAGEWYISRTQHGPMVHARLGITAENSGKLVSLVRRQAREIAQQNNHRLILVDGPPGIGCPVIASLTGASLALIVAEPTLSGVHDVQRVAKLLEHFHIDAYLCVNKWDINPSLTAQLERSAAALGVKPIGRVRYDVEVTRAQIQGQSLVEVSDGGAASDIRALWADLSAAIYKEDANVQHIETRA